MTRPILVTGAHRSGTTWVGQMLCASGEAAYVHEPFNLVVHPGWTAAPLPHWYLYVTDENADLYRPLVEPSFRLRFPVRKRPPRGLSPRAAAVVAARAAQAAHHRLRRRRPLVKDPLALFSAEWLAASFDAVPVVMIRHPAAFASSLRRLSWRFDFRNWLDQPLLLRDHLHPFEAEMRRHVERPGEVDLIDEAALMWRAIYATVAAFRRRHPDWVFLRHEDLAAGAATEFPALYRRTGLTWNARAEEAVARSTSGDEAESRPGDVAPSRRDSAAIGRLWARRLPPDDVARLEDAVGDVSAAFYSADDWL